MNQRFADWIEAQLECRSMTQLELADRLGLSYKHYMVAVRTDPLDGQFVWKVANTLPVEDAYQAAGLAPPFSVQTEREQQLLCLFRQLTDEERETVIAKAKALAGQGG